MSVVTNLAISLSAEDRPKMVEVDRFFVGGVKGFIEVNDPCLPRGWYGGDKMIEANLYLGAFNHLDLNRFIAHLRAIRWERPECVQLLVKEDGDERFRLINIIHAIPTLIGKPPGS